MSGAYYNEIDAYAAEWLRNLIAAGHIAPGGVDERSIEDVTPDDLRGFTQCHFFAGIGVWSRALRSAGWPDDHPVWTGSCPCQPFSAAGQGKGFADERHLWPAFHHLIHECRPPAVIGEQVASKDADTWLDLIQTDLEALDYAFGAVPFPSAGIGAPHIRDRLYWVANAELHGLNGTTVRRGTSTSQGKRGLLQFEGCSTVGRVGNNNNTRLEGLGCGHQAESGRVGAIRPVAEASESCGLADHDKNGRESGHRVRPLRQEHDAEYGGSVGAQRTRPTNGHWRDADWLFCRDGKWRPVEPGAFPLANGASARVGRLRAYGNAINASQAQIFIEAFIDYISGEDLG